MCCVFAGCSKTESGSRALQGKEGRAQPYDEGLVMRLLGGRRSLFVSLDSAGGQGGRAGSRLGWPPNNSSSVLGHLQSLPQVALEALAAGWTWTSDKSVGPSVNLVTTAACPLLLYARPTSSTHAECFECFVDGLALLAAKRRVSSGLRV